MPQLARRESRKNFGPAEETRDHCFRVHEERGLLPHVPTEGRVPPKQAPETGTSCGYQLGPQRWARNAMLPPLPPKILCASTGYYPHPPGSLCSRPLPGSQDLRTTSPGEHTVRLRLLQCHASLCRHRLAPHSNYDYCTLFLPGLSEQETPNQSLLQLPPVWEGNRCLRVTYMQRRGQNHS